MKFFVLSPLLLLIALLAGCAAEAQAGMLEDVVRNLESGKAVLVDVREPAEWRATGVAAPARLLSKGSFDSGSEEWQRFLAENRDKEIYLMCRSGNRSGQLTSVLLKQGFRVINLGAYSEWKAAGLPVRQVP